MKPELVPEVVPLVRLAVVRAGPVVVGPAARPLEEEIAGMCRTLAARHRGKAPAQIEGLDPARRLYKAFGIDPTQTRPSSEALLRRILQEKPFPRVLNAVDVGNLCSVAFLLPLGLYDLGKVRGEVVLRRGAPGETYAGIRKDAVHVGGRPTLADAEGPFGNPTSDSLRTCVTSGTTAIAMVIFAPASYPAAELRDHAVFGAERMRRHLGGAGVEPTVAWELIPA
ncbi:MAG TPA: phenylalanine--tRNA ligase beta subunit-related protein [Candidatus Polarisedimenticolaceae bacterium]